MILHLDMTLHAGLGEGGAAAELFDTVEWEERVKPGHFHADWTCDEEEDDTDDADDTDDTTNNACILPLTLWQKSQRFIQGE